MATNQQFTGGGGNTSISNQQAVKLNQQLNKKLNSGEITQEQFNQAQTGITTNREAQGINYGEGVGQTATPDAGTPGQETTATTPGVGIPGVNMPPYGPSDGTEQPTQEPTQQPDYTTEGAIAATGELQEKMTNLQVGEKDAIEANKEADLALIEQQKKELDDIVKQQDDLLAQKERDTADRIERERVAALEDAREREKLSREQAELSRRKLEAEAEFQRKQNESAIIQAQRDIEIQRQQSAWAYNKLGLGFSSGIINQSQQIATDGITKIAEIKALMNYQEAQIGVQNEAINLQLREIEYEYGKLINDTINLYSDKSDDLDSAIEQRLLDTQKNLLLNSQEKANRQNEILKQYRADKTLLERQHIEDMIKIQDRGYAFQKDLEAQLEKEKQTKEIRLEREMVTGMTTRLTEAEKNQREDELGLPRGFIDAQVNNSILTSIQTGIGNILGPDYIIRNTDELSAQIKREIQLGLTIEQASAKVIGNFLKDTPEYKKAKELEKLKEQATERQLRSALTSSGVSVSNVKASDFVKTIADDGRIAFTHKVTGATHFAVSSQDELIPFDVGMTLQDGTQKIVDRVNVVRPLGTFIKAPVKSYSSSVNEDDPFEYIK